MYILVYIFIYIYIYTYIYIYIYICIHTSFCAYLPCLRASLSALSFSRCVSDSLTHTPHTHDDDSISWREHAHAKTAHTDTSKCLERRGMIPYSCPCRKQSEPKKRLPNTNTRNKQTKHTLPQQDSKPPPPASPSRCPRLTQRRHRTPTILTSLPTVVVAQVAAPSARQCSRMAERGV